MTYTNGQLVRLTTDWHTVPAGTNLRIVRKIGLGLYTGDPWQVCRDDEASLPGPYGPGATTVVDGAYLEAAQEL